MLQGDDYKEKKGLGKVREVKSTTVRGGGQFVTVIGCCGWVP